jgi:hypothetical protein
MEKVGKRRIVSEGEEVKILGGYVRTIRPAKSPGFRIDCASGEELGITQRLEHGTRERSPQIGDPAAAIVEGQLKLAIVKVPRLCNMDDHGS